MCDFFSVRRFIFLAGGLLGFRFFLGNWTPFSKTQVSFGGFSLFFGLWLLLGKKG